MRIVSIAAGCVLACLPLTAPLAGAQQGASAALPEGRPVVLDHVVAVINGDVILQSDVEEELRFAALQPYSIRPGRNTPQHALQRLIDRDLILQQMKLGRQTVTPPAESEVEKQLDSLRRQIPRCAQYQCETSAGWQRFLAAQGLTQQEVERRWRQRMLLLKYIQMRFGAGVRISEDAVREDYEKNFVPRFTEKHLQPPPLDTVASRIREILLEKQVNVLLFDWLKSLKQEGSVSILDPAYAQLSSSLGANGAAGPQTAPGGKP